MKLIEGLKRRIRYMTKFGRLFGLRRLLLGSLSKKHWPTEFEVAVRDVAHPFLMRPMTSDVMTFQQIFELREYDVELNREPDTIIDAGANIGLSAIYFANRFPKAKIIAIEPEASNFAVLKRNTQAYKNVTAIQAALWDANGEIEVVDVGIGHWGFQARAAEQSETICHRVPAFTVKAIMSRFGMTHVDVLKIDIEGAEKEVMDASADWIDNVSMLAIELHDRLKPGCTESLQRATTGRFQKEWQNGENLYLARNGIA